MSAPEGALLVSDSMATVGSFVEEHEVRVAGDGDREPEALGFPARQAVHRATGEVRQASPFEDGSAPERARVEAAREVDELLDPDVGRQPGILEHRADPAGCDCRSGRQAKHGHFAGGRLEQAEHEADRRGLAGPVGSEQSDRLAGPDGEIYVVDGGDGTEPAGDSGKAHGFGAGGARIDTVVDVVRAGVLAGGWVRWWSWRSSRCRWICRQCLAASRALQGTVVVNRS